ncbi:MAG: SppA protein [Gammaproteobacteria bacterium]|nr:SppA protein [Gammaproteobacteria bacterium]
MATEKYDGDVYLYYGEILRDGYHQLSDIFETKTQKSPAACIILVTYGGDPDAAYRIARATRHHYCQGFEILIPDVCKSAGTLLCIGADKLIFGDRGELGPLDIQLSKPDELFESMSGLDIVQALSGLQAQVLMAFREYLIDLRGGARLKTKVAANIAAKLTEGFIAPIAAKIDPITLGAHQRAMSIAFDYGQRLDEISKSLKPGSLERLVSGYASHGFVIDRKEARELFRHVEAPDSDTLALYAWARKLFVQVPMPYDEPLVLDVQEFLHPTKEGVERHSEDHDARAAGNDGGTQGGDTSPDSETESEGASHQQDGDQVR